MAYYEELKAKDIIEVVKPMIKEGSLALRQSDGKLVPQNLKLLCDSPWVYHRPMYYNNCYIWGGVVFNNIITASLAPGKRFVPSHCMDCYKVTVKPKTVKQLFELSKVQYTMNLPSKCGIEKRPVVFGPYGGYFYNRSVEEGRACYKKVRAAVDQYLTDGLEVPVMLKRSCTEMEHIIGPSNKWTINQEQLKFEKFLESMFATDVPLLHQPLHLKEHVQATWIEKAYDVGDETVHEFIDGPMLPDYVTYHEEGEDK